MLRSVTALVAFCYLWSNFRSESELLAQAKSAISQQIIGTTDKWMAVRWKDSFNDTFSCLLVSKNSGNLQATKDQVFVSYRNPPRLISWRLDEREIRSNNPSDSDRTGRTLTLGIDWNRILEAKRLRVRVYSVLNEMEDLEFDITGLKEAIKLLEKSECSE